MSVRRDSSADAFAQMQDELAQRAAQADARPLSGAEVATLRHALDAAQRALSRINERGLVYAHRRDFTEARAAIAAARPLVDKRIVSTANIESEATS